VRPVNLIPGDLRRGPRPRGRSASTGYLVIGVMAALLVGVIVLVTTNNQISDRKSDIARLKVEEQQATERAQQLSAFTDFRSAEERRTATVASLAQSRFDWERVMRELSLVLPDNVWLVNLTGTVTPDVTLDGGASLPTRTSVAGPALEIIGCTTSQDNVARFVSALEDIDGATRVGVQSSELGDSTSPEGTSGGGSTSQDCRTRNFIYQFEIVVAFDKAPTPSVATVTTPVPAATTTTGTGG
jgi:Tfp pilus assembly protein PilN